MRLQSTTFFCSRASVTNADKEELVRLIADVVNLDAKKAQAEAEQLRVEELKAAEAKEMAKQTEVLTYYNSFLEGISNGNIRHGEQKRYTTASISAWRTFGNHLREFLSSCGLVNLHFSEITRTTATAFVTYMESKELMKSTMAQQINHFRKLCNMAAEDGINSNAVSLKVWKSHDQKESDKRAEIALTDEEINALYDLKLCGYVEQCRDIWMLGLFSCQRVSDFSKFSRENFCTNADGTPIIKVRQQKTGAELEVPILDERVFELCEKYNYNFPALKRDAINRGIKMACKVLGESMPSLREWEVTLLAGKERDKERWFIDAVQRIAAGEKLHGEDYNSGNQNDLATIISSSN